MCSWGNGDGKWRIKLSWLREFYWFSKMKNGSWIVMRDVSSYEKSLCFVEVWMGAGGEKKRSERALCWVRCLPGGLGLSLHVAWFFVLGRYYTPTVRMWLPVSCLALIIIYVFSRNITYDHCSKYWSNYVLEIKDFIKLMVIWGEQSFHFHMSSK